MSTHDETGGYRKQNRTAVHLAVWTLAWLVTLAVARFGPDVWGEQPVAGWIAVVVNALVGVAWIVAFARFLRAQDDLWRKISLDALAATLGVGWVVGFGYVVADAAGLVTIDLNAAALLPVLLAVVYMVSVLVGWMRYR